ncbi:MAG TPA: ABC transporter permease [Gemmatimonadales bacterium]|jgi:ABC-2 type transport system permease protein
MSALSAVYGIVARDLTRASRQTSRLLGGLARPFMWLLLVGTGYNAIARIEGGISYQAFVYPGIIVMAALFGAMLTAISTVYDREFGMLRLMLASPAGAGAVLTGRALAGTLVGLLQGGIVLACAPLVVPVSLQTLATAIGALALSCISSSVLGLLVAARLRSVENFAGVINVVLFPLLFVSGALYPTSSMPSVLRLLARANPVTYQVDLMRHAFTQPTEFTAGTDVGVLIGVTVALFGLTCLLFDPEQRFIGRPTAADSDLRPRADGSGPALP